MSGNRYVLLIIFVAALGLTAWLMFGFSDWWRYIHGTLLLALGTVSLKAALVASSPERKSSEVMANCRREKT